MGITIVNGCGDVVNPDNPIQLDTVCIIGVSGGSWGS